MRKSEKHRLTLKYDILHYFSPLVKQYNVTYVDDENKPLKIIRQNCNVYAKCSSSNGELLYITFLYAGMATLGIYHGDIKPEHFFFQWHGRTKTNHIYQRLLK